MQAVFFVFCLLGVSFAAPLLVPLKDAPLVVQTTAGAVKGTTKDQSRVFHGIPFAAPPTGNNRFRAPQPVQPWSGTKDCTSSLFALEHVCPQFTEVLGKYLGQEDCLYMSVYTPKVLPSHPLPVMLWIYGGAYVIGDGDEYDLYDGHALAEKFNVIVVAPNYRLTVFGFLAHEALKNDDPHSSSGSYAMLDQRFAMEWVQQNIANFGGDASQVTIFGESAGGFSVCWHLASPGSKGLFRAAIMESGSCASREFFLPAALAENFGKDWTAAAGCDSDKLSSADFLSCIRSLPAAKLLSMDWSAKNHTGKPPLFPALSWGPIIDGSDYTLPDLPINLMEKGEFNKVPLILGTNADEGTIFTPLPLVVAQVSALLTDNDMHKILTQFFNASTVDQILVRYPKSGVTNYPRLAHFLRDWFFTCPVRRVARAVSRSGVPAYLYQFTYPKVEGYRALGDYHASELPYVFGSRLLHVLPIFTKEDLVLSGAIQQFWTNLAYTLDPNQDPFSGNNNNGLIHWPTFDPTTQSNLVLSVPLGLNANLEEDVCDFWDTVKTLY